MSAALLRTPMASIDLRSAVDVERFGGKASALADMLGAGLPVPEGWAIGVDLLDAFVDGRADARDAVAALGRLVDAGGDEALAYAVRSSAVDEDSSSASFAGQHVSVLGVRGASALHEALRAVWNSAHSEAARAYRRRLGLSESARIAAVVQRMLAPEISGVLFTRHPVSGAAERVIEATWGLGEAVVAGLVTPDYVRVSATGETLEYLVGDKDVEIVMLNSGGTEERSVDAARAEAPCLDHAQLSALHRLATVVDDAQPSPRGWDLEWAIEGGGLYLLQRRAITR